MKVAYIGLGSMGGDQARLIARSEHDLTVYDVSEKARDGFREIATVADGIGSAVEDAEVVHVCVRDADQVRDVLFGADKVRLDASLNLDCAAKVGNAPEYARQLNRYLSTSPPHAEFNLALVGQICGLSALAEKEWPACAQNPGAGDVVVFQPHDTGFRVVGCLPFTAVNRWSLRKDLP